MDSPLESPELFVSHVIKQAGGNPQAIYDMVDDTAKERVVNKRQIREIRHQAGIRHLDFTPVMIVGGAFIIGSRYLAIWLGDTALYIMAGMAAALFLSLRFFLFRALGGRIDTQKGGFRQLQRTAAQPRASLCASAGAVGVRPTWA